MSEIDIRSTSGDVVGKATLDDALFGAQINVPVMHQVVRAQLAAARAGTRATKRRGQVSGGGKKPWRQKGTGRARQGSTRAPHWVGGGVVFGPQPKDYSMKVNRKMRAVALRSALSDRAREGRIAVVDSFSFEEPKTKDAVKALEALGVTGKSLLVLEAVDMTIGKSFRNLGSVHIITTGQLNTYDILNADWLVFTKAALDLVGKKPEHVGAEAGETE
jgi:large subunit ribosomal protein L4